MLRPTCRGYWTPFGPTPKPSFSGRLFLTLPFPKARLYGRQLSRVTVWVSTLSFAVEDPLCGFRGVPLQPTIELLEVATHG